MKSNVWKQHAGMFATATVVVGTAAVLLHIATWALVLTGCIGWALGFASQTLSAYVAFSIMHEASHGNIHGRHSRLSWVNELLGWSSGVLLMAPYPAFRLLHLRHHSRTNHEDDPDRYVAGKTWWSIALRCATIVPHYYISFLFGRLKSAPGRRRVFPFAIGFVTAIILIVSVATLTGNLAILLTLWVGPALVANTLLAFLFDWLPHHPHSECQRMRNTRVVLAPGLWLVTIWQNYHLVHHLFPRVPFYRYGTFFNQIRHDLENADAQIDAWQLPSRDTAPTISRRETSETGL